jgi:hypothetical protein
LIADLSYLLVPIPAGWKRRAVPEETSFDDLLSTVRRLVREGTMDPSDEERLRAIVRRIEAYSRRQRKNLADVRKPA